MYCYKCGKKLDDDSVFCSNCGADVQDETVEEQAVTADKPAGKKRKKILIVAIAVGTVAVAVAVCYFCFFNKSEELDLAKNVDMETIDFKGNNGSGSIDFKDISNDIGLEASGTEVKKFEDSITYKAKPTQKLSNGDKVAVTMSYSKDLAKELGLKITNTKFTVIVNGLKEKSKTAKKTTTKTGAQKTSADDLSADDYYSLNIYASNFSEANTETLRAGELTAEDVMRFAYQHNWFNNNDAVIWNNENSGYGYNTKFSKAVMQKTISRFFGSSVRIDKLPGIDGLEEYFGGYYHSQETGGNLPAGFALLYNMREVGGIYTIKYKIYGSGSYVATDTQYYGWSHEKAARKFESPSRGCTLTIKASNFTDESTFEFISYKSYDI